MSKNLLLLSSSRVGETGYLEHALPLILSFLAKTRSINGPLLFIPYAGVSVGFDQYQKKVKSAFNSIGIEIHSIHRYKDKGVAIKQSAGIVIGGGNTFALLNSLYQEKLIEPLKQHIEKGMPYIGWSAGSNITGPTIRTTNDMPIIEPPSFKALELVPWQINPHYIDGNPPGHHGETRQQRIEEFLVINPGTKVIGLPEGTALQMIERSAEYIGETPGFVFSQLGKQQFQQSEQLLQMLTAT